MADADAIRAGKAYYELSADGTQLAAGLADAKKQLKNFGEAVTDIGRKMQIAGAVIAAPAALAAKAFADWDMQIRKISTVLDEPQKHLAEYSDGIREMSVRFGQNTQALSNGLYQILQASVAPDQAMTYLEAGARAAKAGFTEVGVSVDALTNIMGAYGLRAGLVNDVSDKMFNAVKRGKISYQDLADQLGKIAPLAHAAHVSLDQLLGIVMTMRNQGVPMKQMMTQLGALFTHIPDLGDDLMGQLGKFQGKSLTSLLAVGADEPTAKAIVALSTHLGDLQKNIQSSAQSAGATQEALRKMAGAPAAALGKLKEQFNELKTTAGSALSGATAAWYTHARNALAVVTEWVGRHRELVAVLAQTAAAVTVAASVLFAFGGTIKAAASGIAVAHGVIAALNTTWTALSAKASTVAESIKLVAASFSSYRNVQMPALVGIGQMVLGLNLTGTKAEFAAAQILLMSNAEVAAAVKTKTLATAQAVLTAITTAWTTVTNASTAASLKMTAAAVMQAIQAKVLAVSQALYGVALNLCTAAFWKHIAAVTATTIANIALGGSVRGVSAAWIAFKAVLPSAILLAIAAALGTVIFALRSASAYVAKLSDTMEKRVTVNDEARKSDREMMVRLQQLAEKNDLNNTEMAEAQKLAETLTAKYGDLGIVLDRNNKSLTLAADVQSRLNAAMRKGARQDLERQYLEFRNNMDELQRQRKTYTGKPWGAVLNQSWGSAFTSKWLGSEYYNPDLEKTNQQLEEYRNKMLETKRRMEQLDHLDNNAITGTDPASASGDTTGKRIEAENNARLVSAKQNEDAVKRMDEIEAQFAQRRQTQLENEIVEVRKLYEEYKKVLQIQLDHELGKARGNQNATLIYELNWKMKNADLLEEEAVEGVNNKARQKFQTEADQIDRDRTQTENNYIRQRAEQAQDTQLQETMKADPQTALKMLSALLDQARLTAAKAREKYDFEIAVAKNDGQITDDEKNRISHAKENYTKSEDSVSKYAAKLLEAQNTVRQLSAPVAGSFYAASAGALGSEGSAAERTAKAVENAAQNTKAIYNYIQNNSLKFA